MKYFVAFALLVLVATVLIDRTAHEDPAVEEVAAEKALTIELDQPLDQTASTSPLTIVEDQPIADVVQAVTVMPVPVAEMVDYASFGLFDMEVDCDDLAGETRCTLFPGSLPSDHPYWGYPVESLEAMPGDAVANHVLGMRLAGENPEAALGYIVRAVGLSGRPGSLVDFLQGSSWSLKSVNGEPQIENLKRRLAVLTAAERLGHAMVDAAGERAKLVGLISPQEMAEIDAMAEAIVHAAKSIDVTVEYQS